MFKKLFGLKPEVPAVAAEDIYFRTDFTNLTQRPLKDWIELRYHEWPAERLDKAPKQSKVFMTEMRSLLSFHGLAGPGVLQGQGLAKAAALYACCFQSRHTMTTATASVADKVYLSHLDAVRQKAIEAIIADIAMYKARRAKAEREQAVKNRKTVQQGSDTPLIDTIKTLTPDDWHEIAQAYNWDYTLEPLWWISAQPNCDAATATVILAQAEPGFYFDEDQSLKDREATIKARLHDIAKRLSSGFYQHNVLLLDESESKHWQGVVDELNGMAIPGVKIPTTLFYRNGKRRHRPSVSITDDKLIPLS